MDDTIEMSIDSPDGIIDCQLEPERSEGNLSYSITILYPNMVNGFSRSEIYCHNMQLDPTKGGYYFETGDVEIHPKIKKLEGQISDAIIKETKQP